jgi:peptidoglycan hydrolase-like protein with peptidoglycan-binding domain
MKDSIAESLAAIRSLESQEILNEAAVAAPAAAASKGIGRFIPGVGAALGAYDAYGRAKQGDWAGAGLSALGGAASLIPGVGTAASIGIAGAQALRDKQRTGSYMPGEDEIAAAVAKDATAQPAVAQAKPNAAPAMTKDQIMAFQKANGLTPDGVLGPKTQAALNAQKTKGTAMSETQKIAELRNRLAQIESSQQVDEISLGGIGAGIKNFGSAVKTGFTNPEYAKVAGMSTRGATKGQVVNKASNIGAKTGKALNTTAKVGAGAAVGAGAMAALGGGGATNPTDKPTVKPAVTPAAPAQTPNAGPDKADVDALNAMAAELENSQDPADIELMKRYNGIINAINNGAKDDKRTIGQQAANADAGSEKEPGWK